MSIAFVFTNYNNSKFTKLAVESIQRSDAKDSPVIVVDNASTVLDQNLLKTLELQYPQIKVIYNATNLGYFPGLNIGIEYAHRHHPEAQYLVVGNNDLEFSEQIASEILKKTELLGKYPVISPNITMLDGSPQNPHVVTGISKFREFIYDLYHSSYILADIIIKLASLTHRFTDRRDEQQHAIPQEISQGYGACYILTPLFFKTLKTLWAPTFLMYEEFFLSKQLEDNGYKVFYEPSIKVRHHCHASTGQLPGRLRWEYSRKAHKEYRKYVKVIR